MVRSIILAGAFLLAATSYAAAQGNTSVAAPDAQSSSLKSATTTFLGDTGLWFVPTAEVLAHGQWSASGYRRGTNYIQGFSNVADFALTAAYGLGDRVEVFGSFIVDTRIDRDLRPLFTSDQEVGGFIDRYPRMRTTWSGNNLGDLNVGAKVSLLPRVSLYPVALAARFVMKAPTGDVEKGVSTGKVDMIADLVASKEWRQLLELAAYAGYEWRGQPDGFTTPSGAFRWGGGAGFPSRTPLRGQLELTGIVANAETATVLAPLVATDGSVAPMVSATENITRATAGLTWQAPHGFFVGGGLSWNVPRRNRDRYRTDASNFGDFVDWQVRVGFHPGTRPRTLASPRAADDKALATSTSRVNRPPVEPAALPKADAEKTMSPAPPAAGSPTDTVSPAAPAGDASAPRAAAPALPAPAPSTYAFEDVHFDFDRYSLRPEATRVLDDAVNAMRQNDNLRLEIEGHTCNIGTAEYNLALGDRRANAVRDYLVQRGLSPARLSTISYGEERAKYDNAREETRRLNRRAALVVNLR